jgi:hypothetical protein
VLTGLTWGGGLTDGLAFGRTLPAIDLGGVALTHVTSVLCDVSPMAGWQVAVAVLAQRAGVGDVDA